MAPDYDVAVVGGRAAGAATALLLARAGLRVAVLERTRHGSDTVSTHALMRAGVLQLARWGVLPEIVDAGTPPVHHTLFHHPDQDVVDITIRRSPGVDALYAPRRHLLDRVLVDAAADAGADVRHEVSVTGLLEEGGRVAGVELAGARAGTRRLTTRMVVGADGVSSTVARQVDAPTLLTGSGGTAVLYRYYSHLPAAGYEWAYGDGAAAGLIPTNDGLTCAFVITTPARMRHLAQLGRDHAFDLLAEMAWADLPERTRAAVAESGLRGWGGLAGFVRRPWGPGWSLVGDAGYYKDPIAAHGLTDALRDAELLADALIAHLSGASTEAAALARYQRERDALSHRFFVTIDALASFEWDQRTVRGLLRESSSAMNDEVEALGRRPWRDLASTMTADRASS